MSYLGQFPPSLFLFSFFPMQRLFACYSLQHTPFIFWYPFSSLLGNIMTMPLYSGYLKGACSSPVFLILLSVSKIDRFGAVSGNALASEGIKSK